MEPLRLYEFLAYLVLGLLVPRPDSRRGRLAIIGLLLACLVLAAPRFKADIPFELFTFARLGCYFFAGAALYALSRWVRWEWSWALVALGLVTALGLTGRAMWLAALPVAYLLLWLGRVLPMRWGATHDVSYGIYLYGYPAQQVVDAVMPGSAAPTVALLAFGLAIPLAWFSWLVVERPAMRLR